MHITPWSHIALNTEHDLLGLPGTTTAQRLRGGQRVHPSMPSRAAHTRVQATTATWAGCWDARCARVQLAAAAAAACRTWSHSWTPHSAREAHVCPRRRGEWQGVHPRCRRHRHRHRGVLGPAGSARDGSEAQLRIVGLGATGPAEQRAANTAALRRAAAAWRRRDVRGECRGPAEVRLGGARAGREVRWEGIVGLILVRPRVGWMLHWTCCFLAGRLLDFGGSGCRGFSSVRGVLGSRQPPVPLRPLYWTAEERTKVKGLGHNRGWCHNRGRGAGAQGTRCRAFCRAHTSLLSALDRATVLCRHRSRGLSRWRTRPWMLIACPKQARTLTGFT